MLLSLPWMPPRPRSRRRDQHRAATANGRRPTYNADSGHQYPLVVRDRELRAHTRRLSGTRAGAAREPRDRAARTASAVVSSHPALDEPVQGWDARLPQTARSCPRSRHDARLLRHAPRRKLGIAPGMTVALIDAPLGSSDTLDPPRAYVCAAASRPHRCDRLLRGRAAARAPAGVPTARPARLRWPVDRLAEAVPRVAATSTSPRTCCASLILPTRPRRQQGLRHRRNVVGAALRRAPGRSWGARIGRRAASVARASMTSSTAPLTAARLRKGSPRRRKGRPSARRVGSSRRSIEPATKKGP